MARLVMASLLAMGLLAWSTPPATAGELDDLYWTFADIEYNGLVYDSNSELLLVTAKASDPDYANQLVAFDPQTLIVEWSIEMGSEIGAVAVSDDGSRIYVGMDELRSVARINAATRSVGDTFALPSDEHYGPMQAQDIAVAPGDPDLIAVALQRVGITPNHVVVAIFDNGTLLPQMTPNFTGSNSIEFGPTASILYGQNTESTERGFYRMTVSETGVVIDDVTERLAHGAHNTFHFVDGRSYFRYGEVVDPTVPVVVDTYTTDGSIVASAPLPSLGMTMTLSNPNVGVSTLSVFDIDGFNLLDSTKLDLEYYYPSSGAIPIDGHGMAAKHGNHILIAGFFPGGNVTGKVTDAIDGAPISEACVFATDDQTYIFGETETLDDGTYSMRVPPGTWRILFGDCHYNDYFWEWHSGRVYYEFDKATPITVSDGATVTINASLDRSFTDSLGSIFEDQIWWMHDAGITAGCGPETYCPDETVTRGQMAAFLVRALGLSATSDIDFVDDDTSIFEAPINRLATAGITKGCNPPTNDKFCPNDPVTRGQMAAFLSRALGLSATSDIDFVDDDGSVFETNINKLATAGITRGCNPPTNDKFCPNDPVTRGQMAAFLSRALKDDFALPLLPTEMTSPKAPLPTLDGPRR